ASSRITLGSAMTASSRWGARHYTSERTLEAVLARAVHVTGRRAPAAAAEAETLVETVRVLEARVGPQLEALDGLRVAPVEHERDQRLAEPEPALPRIEVEAMQLRPALAFVIDTDRADDAFPVGDDPERALRRRVVR